jgi:hypothetical protein
MFATVFGCEACVIKDDIEETFNKINEARFKNMVKETHEVVDDVVNNEDMSVQSRISKLCIVILNSTKVTPKEVETLTKDEAKSYINDVNEAKSCLEHILNVTCSTLNKVVDNHIYDKDNTKENLSKLSKEELIEMLMKK